MNTAEIIQAESKYVLQTYIRPSIVFTHGDGIKLFDIEGNEYLDFSSGIAVTALGHSDNELTKAIADQAGRLTHISNLYHSEPQVQLAKFLVENSFADKAYFCNSGAEANEVALKLARRHHYVESGGVEARADADSSFEGRDRTEIIAFDGSFHGRTLFTLTATGQPSYREGFEPVVQGIHHAPFNDLDAVKQLASDRTAAILVEPIQGEGGIRPATSEFLSGLRELADDCGCLLIFDEIQTGMGRTGTMWAAEYYDVVPDIMTFGKAFGGGVMPITGIVARPHLWVDELIENPWVLGSPTFGGNPLACAAAIAAIKFTLENDLPKQIAEKGEYLMGKLNELKEKHNILVDVRGKGFLIGLEYPTPEMGWAVSKGLFKRGIMTGGTLNNAKVNRIEPPGILSYETLDLIIAKLDETLAEVELEFNVSK